MYVLTVTAIEDDCLVDMRLIDEDKAKTILGNLHIASIKENKQGTILVETTGGAFRYFFDEYNRSYNPFLEAYETL